MTLFLREPGAVLDNTACERVVKIVSKSSSRDPRVGMGGAFTRSPIYGLGQARSGKGPARLGYGFIEAGRWTGWDRMA